MVEGNVTGLKSGRGSVAALLANSTLNTEDTTCTFNKSSIGGAFYTDKSNMTHKNLVSENNGDRSDKSFDVKGSRGGKISKFLYLLRTKLSGNK